MKTVRNSATIIATIALTLTTLCAYAQDNGSPSRGYLDSGTVVPIVMDTKLSSNNAWTGQRFQAHIKDGSTAIPSGSKVFGHVSQIVQKHGKTPGSLTLAYDRIQTPNGQVIPINAYTTSEQTQKLNVDNNGAILSKPTDQNKKAVTDSAVGAGAGALYDLLTNHGKINASHVIIGAGAGYGASRINMKTGPTDVTINPGAQIGIKLNRSLYVFNRAH